MEEKINIAEILKNKPRGTKLYDWLHNIDVELDTISTTDTETVVWCTNETNNNTTCHRGYSEFGTERGYPDGLQILFPSKEMRDWAKFSWKKGDVLQNNDHNIQVIFGGFTSDTYEMIRCKYWLKVDNGNEKFVIETNEFTKNFFKISEELSQCYINEIENRLGGKLNLETLKIEKTQPEFKDGDIVVAEEDNYYDKVIFIAAIKDDIVSKALINVRYEDYEVHYNEYRFGHNRSLRLATDSEKQQLFEALAKENKAWDAEKKQIVNLKPKYEFKPFDRCIWKIRNCEGSIWQASFVSYVDEHGATPMGISIDEDLVNLTILPYNDQTKLLVGTTDEWKGGEG